MNEEEFIEIVRRKAALDSDEAARAVTEATLATLAERITDGQARDLAADLPDGIASPLVETEPGEAEVFALKEFTDRVEERAGIDGDAVVNARAVVAAVSMASDDALAAAREQLPAEFDLIFEPGGPIREEEFLETVRNRAGMNSIDEARDAVEATLRTLSERLTEGQAADLALYLPEEFEDWATAAEGDEAEPLSLDEFVVRVSQREGVEKEDARQHVHAVGSTVAESASDREVENAKKQLPDPFGAMFEPPEGVESDA